MRRAAARCLLGTCRPQSTWLGPLTQWGAGAAEQQQHCADVQHQHQQQHQQQQQQRQRQRQQHQCQQQQQHATHAHQLHQGTHQRVDRDRTLEASCSPGSGLLQLHAARMPPPSGSTRCSQVQQQPQQQPQLHQQHGPANAAAAVAPGLWAALPRAQHQHQHQHQRHPHPDPNPALLLGAVRRYASRPATNPSMPEALAGLIQEAGVNAAVRPPPPPLEPRPLTFASRRSGVIAVKAGMMQDWDEFGARVPLTVLWVDECMVVRHKHVERDGVTSLVLGCGAKRAKQLHPRQLGEFQAAGMPLKRKLWEVPVSEDGLLPPGTLLGAAHFRAGQYVDITGTTKGKGFAGVMKRWGFAGQPASHGNTKHHRAPGAIGGRTDPGKVWKGKKMPGHLGHERMTFKNIWLYKVDPERNLLYVRGQVPGPAGSFVLVRDAFRWKWAARQAAQLPFPTHIGELPPLAVAKRDGEDPYRVYREDIGYFEANWKGE